MRVVLTFLFCLITTFAHAQDLPALYRVVNVAPDDLLNMRQDPTSASIVLDTLAPTAENVEVIEFNAAGTWGRVNLREASGWVFMKYLAPMPAGEFALGRALSCLGTEPFWHLEIDQAETSVFSAIDAQKIEFNQFALFPSENQRMNYAFQAESGSSVAFGSIQNTICSDLMSDRLYGLSVTLLLQVSGEKRALSGCCSLVGN